MMYVTYLQWIALKIDMMSELVDNINQFVSHGLFGLNQRSCHNSYFSSVNFGFT